LIIIDTLIFHYYADASASRLLMPRFAILPYHADAIFRQLHATITPFFFAAATTPLSPLRFSLFITLMPIRWLFSPFRCRHIISILMRCFS